MNAYNFANPVVLSEPETVDAYLAKLGLTQIELVSALERGLSARHSTTPNHPVTSAGQFFFAESVSGLRDILAPKGFTKQSLNNVELTSNDEIALYICRSCEQTGLPKGRPESHLKKGDFTVGLLGLIHDDYPGQGRLSLDDVQMDLDLGAVIHDLPTQPMNKLGKDLWMLLYHLYEIDEHHRMGIRAELARPVSYNSRNIINGFSTRLILNTHTPDLLFSSNDEPQFTPDIELDISKAG